MPKIISKKLHHSGFEGFEFIIDYGRGRGRIEWSLLNFADSMKNHPFPASIYMGWEAMGDYKGEMIIIREDNSEKLIKKIIYYFEI